MHLLQDSMSPDGIPIMPHAWDVKDYIQKSASISPKIATALVSINFRQFTWCSYSRVFIHSLWGTGESVVKKRKIKKHIEAAQNAFQSFDYNSVVANYKSALDIERNPRVLMALGQVYMQRVANRLRSHQAFTDAITLLAKQPDEMFSYHNAKISVRGVAGIQALATADTLAGIHPEHWNDHVRDLVNATVSSFSAVASKLSKEGDDFIPNNAVTPAHFSAAINYYLAAKSACNYPFNEEKEDTVSCNVQSALRSLELVAQYDEEKLRTPVTTIGKLWMMELLPPDTKLLAM